MKLTRLLIPLIALSVLGTSFTPSYAVTLPTSFLSLTKQSVLNDPGIIVLDPKSNEIVYESNPDVTRAPASVLKLVSTTDALKTFGADKTFNTNLYATDKGNKFLLVGEGDPWLTTSQLEASK